MCPVRASGQLANAVYEYINMYLPIIVLLRRFMAHVKEVWTV